jgi:hypothetical protein
VPSAGSSSTRNRRRGPGGSPRMPGRGGRRCGGGACQEPATACAVPAARGPGGTGAGPESGAPRRADLGPRGPLHEAACCPGPGRLASAVALPPDTSGTARPSAPRGIGGVDWSASTPPDGVPYSRACRAMKVVGKPSAGTPPVRVEGAEGGHQDCGPRRHSLTLPADGLLRRSGFRQQVSASVRLPTKSQLKESPTVSRIVRHGRRQRHFAAHSPGSREKNLVSSPCGAADVPA